MTELGWSHRHHLLCLASHFPMFPALSQNYKENLCSFSNLEAQEETSSDPVLVRIPLLGKEGVEEHPNI